MLKSLTHAGESHEEEGEQGEGETEAVMWAEVPIPAFIIIIVILYCCYQILHYYHYY